MLVRDVMKFSIWEISIDDIYRSTSV